MNMAEKEKSREVIKELEKKSVGDVKVIQTKPLELEFPKSEPEAKKKKE
jgi:hypothetical protein